MKRHLYKIGVLLIVCMVFLSQQVLSSELINIQKEAENAMVASAHPLATQAGLEILRKGGNAVDAAVATAFAIGVVEPNASGLGGEGMMLIRLADGESVAIDYRSCAPKAIYEYDGEDYGPKSVAIPGTVAGLTLALNEYGTLSLPEVMSPAIKYAEEGFTISETLGGIILDKYEQLLADPASSKIYLEDSLPKKAGDILKQPDLARSLRLISKKGADVFYKGELADKIAYEMQKNGGIITKEDLANYKAVERRPVTGNYRGYTVISSPPPVSGMAVVEALNILENFDLSKYDFMSYEVIHLMSEAVRLAYCDRYTYMADPDFVAVPLGILLSEDYAAERAKKIDLKRQIPDSELLPGLQLDVKESSSTTHLVVADKQGNMVSLTQTISSFFGSGYVVEDTGILMNNEMKNFNSRGINVMEPYKRMRTTIAPTILVKDDKPFLTIGTPGAARIVPTTVNVIVNIVDYGMGLQEAIEAPRFYSRLNTTIYLEDRFPEIFIKALEKKGATVEIKGEMDLYFGGVQAVMYDLKKGIIYGGADPRRDGYAEGF